MEIVSFLPFLFPLILLVFFKGVTHSGVEEDGGGWGGGGEMF